MHSLFEAARWAASSYNAQPWFFIVATKDDRENYKKILDCFVEFNQGWAKNAPVLALSVARMNFEKNGAPNRHAFHDVGQASANLALEATNLGLQIHQMAGILPDQARQIFSIPEGYEAVAGIAIGYPGDPATLPDELREREHAPRTRKPLDSFVFTGRWGEVSPIVRAVKK
jgi:nitroreductase